MMLKFLIILLLSTIAIAAEKSHPLASAPHDKEVIERTHYTLSYNEEHNVANWVAYTLERFHLRNCVKRSNSFRIDPLIQNGTASPKDYTHTGFDRGHLLPAGDMKFSAQAMRDTFYMSNVTPQTPLFNRGRWSTLEYLFRAWTYSYQKAWIVTGPIIRSSLPRIGKDNLISVPEEHFKVILVKNKGTYKGIGFIMHADVPFPDLSSYVVSIRQVEELTGIDFFSFLPKEIQEEVENEADAKKWNFNARFDYLPCSA
jgi:endonuclease G, mitochondrial